MNQPRPPILSAIATITALLSFAAFTGCGSIGEPGSSRDRARLSTTGSIGGSGSAGIQRFTSHDARTPGFQSSRTVSTGTSSQSGSSPAPSSTAGESTDGAEVAQATGEPGGEETAYTAPREKTVPESRIKPLRAGAIGGSGSRGFNNR